MPHIPVLLQEVLEYLDPKPGEFVIDGTADGGGHSEAILKRLEGKGRLLAIDWDEEILRTCKKRIGLSKNILFAVSNYAEISSVLLQKNLPQADVLLLDLGFSSSQVDDLGRGFSFRTEHNDDPLLMTYNNKMKPVREIIRELTEEELARLIKELGGERMAKRVARVIKERLRKSPIQTSGQLADAVREALPRGYERGRIDPATRTFQALRIYANRELENLERALSQFPEILTKGGRAAIITFHSIEDRIVKIAFKNFERSGQWRVITKKPITPSRREVLENSRSRSAKLRVIQRIF